MNKLKLTAVIFVLLFTSYPGIIQAQPGVIEITYIPIWDSHEFLEGIVRDVNPSEYNVAVYIYVEGGWWTKPYAAAPITPINPDCTWTCNVNTGGMDGYAVRFASFLIPVGYDPPVVLGEPELPDTLYTFPYDLECRLPGTRTIDFSGFTWVVKQCEQWQLGPGPNYFSDDTTNVWVDENERLHLKIAYLAGEWYCSEVIADSCFGYGEYRFYLEPGIDDIHQNAVIGLFTWDEYSPESNFSEIDIEFSQWGNASQDSTGQYVIQPHDTSGNRHRFIFSDNDTCTVHKFSWTQDQIDFLSAYGDNPDPPPSSIIETWTYTGNDIPAPYRENVRINFWLCDTMPSAGGEDMEIIITGFEFIPPSGAVSPGLRGEAPEIYYFHEPRPNPFNEQIIFTFDLTVNSQVNLSIYNLMGQEVAVLAGGNILPGQHKYTFNAAQFTSGLYFARLSVGDVQETNKILYLK